MKTIALLLLAISRPAPGIAPEEVVRNVVSALRHSNSPIPNAGIYTAYQFASPANHAATGPYGNFLGIVKSRDFAPLLHDDAIGFSEMIIRGEKAEQIVRLQSASFKFTLSVQHRSPCVNCWMIDGVSRMYH
jgi:hypothetical protein